MEEKNMDLQPAAETPEPETQPDELLEDKRVTDVSSEPTPEDTKEPEAPPEEPQEKMNPADIPSEPVSEDAKKPETYPDELHEKIVFTDISSASIWDDTDTLSAIDTPQPSFHDRVVLDEAYAARSNPLRTAAPAPQPLPSARRDFNTARPYPRKKRLPSRPSFLSARLYSGELPADALRRIVRQICALLLFCLIVFGVFWIKDFVSDRLTDNSYASLAKSTVYSEPVACRNFSVEPTDLLDSYVLAQAVCTKVGSPITDPDVFEKEAGDTVFPAEVATCMESALPPDRVLLKENITNLDLLIQIHESLRANKPVIVLLSDASAAEFTLQYAAVTQMDVEQDRITVANPNVGTQIYTLEEFIAATRFKNFDDMPYQTKLALTFGIWSPNTAIFVE